MQSTTTIRRTAAILLALEVGIFLTAFYILGSAINWPASLGLPASEGLPLVLAHRGAVFTGYYFYLISSILLIPMTAFLACALGARDPLDQALLKTAMLLGATAAVLKVMGIMRWLFAMLYLGELYDTNPEARQTATILYDVLNLYAGKLGEHGGVELLSAAFVCVFGIVLVRRGLTAIGGYALFVALITLPFEDLLGVDLGPIKIINGTALFVWYLWLAARLWSPATNVSAGREG